MRHVKFLIIFLLFTFYLLLPATLVLAQAINVSGSADLSSCPNSTAINWSWSGGTNQYTSLTLYNETLGTNQVFPLTDPNQTTFTSAGLPTNQKFHLTVTDNAGETGLSSTISTNCCTLYVNTTTCGQPSYDTCTPICNGTSAAYTCVASQDSDCQGTLLCAAEDSRCTSSPSPSGCSTPNNPTWRDQTPGVDGFYCQTAPGVCATDACVGVPYSCDFNTHTWVLVDPPGLAGECTTVCAGFCTPGVSPSPQPTSGGGTFDVGPNPAGIVQLEQLFINIVYVAVGLGFIALFVFLAWAGFKYLTSGGEAKAIHIAHQTVTWALLGIIFLALAWLILQLISVFTGINVTIFNLRTLF